MRDDWEDQLYQLLIKHEVSLLPYVPDAGHAALISKADKGDEIATVVLSTEEEGVCLLYTSPSPRDQRGSRMPSSA